MSVLIKGMDMPENCRSCFFRGTFGWGASYCRMESDLRPLDNTLPTINNPDARPDWCPLEEFHLIEFRGFTGAVPENVVVGLDSMASANRFDDLLRRRVKKAAEKICDEIMENVKKEMQEEVKKAREIEDGH